MYTADSVKAQREMQCANVLTRPIQHETSLNQYNLIDCIIILSFLVYISGL